ENLNGRLPQDLSLTTRQGMLLYSPTAYQLHPNDLVKGSLRLDTTPTHTHGLEDDTQSQV
ncbi:hypothetical protein SARC_15472, partial [Sphaeroforma arctica JP610]